MEAQQQTTQPIAVGLSQAASLSGLSKRSLRYFIDAGRLPACRMGRRLLIRVDSFNQFLSCGFHPGPTEKLQQGKDKGES